MGHAHKLRLPAVDAAAERPAAVGIGAVVHPAVAAEVTLAAKGLHVHRHPVAGTDGLYLRADSLHDTDHLMADGDARHGARHGAVLDVQVAGAD